MKCIEGGAAGAALSPYERARHELLSAMARAAGEPLPPVSGTDAKRVSANSGAGVAAIGDRPGPSAATARLSAEEARLHNWQNAAPANDGLQGTGASRAYAAGLAEKGVEPVVVAVIDSGFDIHHEDLKDRLWVNPGEIAGNGRDDDGNGYVDDVHGWNFLGSVDAKGQPINIDKAPLEVTRELARLRALKREAGSLTEADARTLAKVEGEVTSARRKLKGTVRRTRAALEKAEVAYRGIAEAVGKPFSELTVRDLDAYRPTGVDSANRKTTILGAFREAKVDSVAALRLRIERAQDRLDHQYNPSFDPRAEIIGDDPFDFEHRHYGNPDVVGPNPRHGSHVASIIGSTRDNGKGIDGIAHDVRLMVLRAVPDGDEWDKDVANAIRYAVDNGAKIINMSFGKPISPGKAAVDEAVAYAAEKGVLLIHSAGNESRNTDEIPTYPNPWKGDSKTERFENWITVGASSADLGDRLVAYFSNFGQRTVELFAPGVKVRAALPGKNEDGEWRYGALSGTSMAAPTVAGVAALVLSQYPGLEPREVRSLLMRTARKLPGLQVQKPGGKPGELVPFESLSSTGGIVDAYAALEEAMELYGRARERAVA